MLRDVSKEDKDMDFNSFRNPGDEQDLGGEGKNQLEMKQCFAETTTEPAL